MIKIWYDSFVLHTGDETKFIPKWASVNNVCQNNPLNKKLNEIEVCRIDYMLFWWVSGSARWDYWPNFGIWFFSIQRNKYEIKLQISPQKIGGGGNSYFSHATFYQPVHSLTINLFSFVILHIIFTIYILMIQNH